MRTFRFWRGCAAALLAAGFLAGCTEGVPADLAAVVQYESPAVTARKKLMRARVQLLKRIKTALKQGKGWAVQEQLGQAARELAANARKTPEAFAVRDMAGKTRALPAIWQKKSQFDQIAANLAASAELLAIAAQGGDMGGAQTALKTIGGNCGKCHKAFRAKKKKK